MEEMGFMTYTAASHQVVNEMASLLGSFHVVQLYMSMVAINNPLDLLFHNIR